MKLYYRRQALVLAFVSLALSGIAGCSTAPKSQEGKIDIEKQASSVLSEAQENDSSLAKRLGSAAGYAVFPRIGKGAIGVGGAYGKGVLFENGVVVGYCDLTQGTIGVQLGAQSYAEIIVFESPRALETFKQGKFQFGAQATAVALKSGVGANAKYTDGVAVFTMAESGLMYEAAVGGQSFDYVSK